LIPGHLALSCASLAFLAASAAWKLSLAWGMFFSLKIYSFNLGRCYTCVALKTQPKYGNKRHFFAFYTQLFTIPFDRISFL
jgi:hypothetical protein